MGAKRTGSFQAGNVTTTWYNSYGGNCASAQLNVAKKLIAGQRI
jgi:hypothetical protein